jgi:uncharacterized protein (DUF58 family)
MAKGDGRRFGLIVIGDEILSGRRQDKHLAKMIELLSERGLSLSPLSKALQVVMWSSVPEGLVQRRTITREPQQQAHSVCNWHCIHKPKSSLRRGL